MLALLDDPSALVRRALAEAIAGHPAPRSVVLGLAADQTDIAALVLAQSPVLSVADLIDAAALGDPLCQVAIAGRPDLDVGVAAALVEVGGAEAILALLANPLAEMAEGSLRRAAERFGDEAAVREALLARADLPVALRHQLSLKVAASLSAWASACGLMTGERAQRATREATEKVAVRLASDHAADLTALEDLVGQLRASGTLTPGLILRSLLSGDTALAEAALASLSGLPIGRVANILHDRRGAGVAALCRRAHIPGALAPAFEAAVAALAEIGFVAEPHQAARLKRRIVERVLIACDSCEAGENAPLMAMLRRFEAEAAREEAALIAESLADDAALAMLLAVDPELTLLAQEPPEPLARAA
jgi:uncharacterized protein (DUF2336 family)